MLKSSMDERAIGGNRAWQVAMVVAAAIILGAASARAASIRAYVIPSASMSPTLAVGDRVLILQGVQNPGRGEVWVHNAVGATRPPGARYVKRIVGVPGDAVEVRGGVLRINGAPLVEPYLAGPIGYSTPPRRLGPGEYFLLGDNRNNSNDSHAFGPVTRSTLLGRVMLRYWPLGRLGGL